MAAFRLVVDSYFDGAAYHAAGPYAMDMVDGVIQGVAAAPPDENAAAAVAAPGDASAAPAAGALRAPFAMPGLVESHCHLFLDGAELNVQVRKAYLKAPLPEMMAVAWRNLQANLAAGITLIRDAGDFYGVNTHLKQNLRRHLGLKPELRSAGRGLRKAGQYGGFIGVPITDTTGIVPAIHGVAPEADDLKILLTGIIDFEHGRMKGPVQFNLDETRLIVETARQLRLHTFAHCSGPEGLQVAAAAGIHSIEHGFFMSPDILKMMADKQIAWDPTFAPVYFQFARPELAGWNAETVRRLDGILKQHFEMAALADELGVPLLAGSDAGSYGVAHGTGLIDELFFLRQAGLSMEKVLAAATSTPRRLWGAAPANIAAGQPADLLILAGSPFDDPEFLRQGKAIYRGGQLFELQPAAASCASGLP